MSCLEMHWPQVLTIPTITETYQETGQIVKHLSGFLVWRVTVDSSPSEVLLYTRAGCHLCDDALGILRSHGLAVRTINIDDEPELKLKYDECVPVVVIDGRERFRGRIDEVLLRRLLRGRGNAH
jgi:glutaredoxin